MDPSRVSRILEDWNGVANKARRPSRAPQGVVVRNRLPGATLAGAGIVVVALVLAGTWLNRPGPNGIGGASSSPSPSPTPPAIPAATESPAIPIPALTPTPEPTTAHCDPNTVHAAITMWEGAAGHRIADVELTNIGPDPCLADTMSRPQLVDGKGAVLIEGADPASSTFVLLDPGDVLRTLVQTGNYCGPTPPPPVTVAFINSDGDSIVASPLSPTDATIPPCLGAPESAGTIEMQPWAP